MPEPDDIAPALIKTKRISGIWILPIIAVLIGIGMLYNEWRNQGQLISISFENAEGLEAKTTKVKFRNVDIGTLESIEFTDDGNAIIANAVIDRDMARFLRRDSQFWVVRPRIGTTGISGFSTLLSGAYIHLEAGKESALTNSYIGLEAPPVSSPNDGGLKVSLIYNGGDQLRPGNPVVYRGFEVGVVEKVDFDVESREILYEIFIRAPYHSLVTTNTFFWNVGGFEVEAKADGFTIDFASFETLIAGGVEFDIPDDLPLGERVTEVRSYKLYPDEFSVTNDRVYEYIEYAILVEDSVAGIEIGTPVEYRGIPIGRVGRPYLTFQQTNAISPGEERIPLIIHIEPKRFIPDNSMSLDDFDLQFKQWIENGLAATVETANFLTGAMKISLSVSNTPSTISSFGEYKVIPVGETGFDSLFEKSEQLLAKLNNLDAESLIESVNLTMNTATETIAGAGEVMKNANVTVSAAQALIANMDQTMAEVQVTLQGLQPESALYGELEGNLIRLQSTMDKLQPFIEQVSAKPNLLIFDSPSRIDNEPKLQSPQGSEQ